MNVHNISIDHPDFKTALLALVSSCDRFKLKRLEGQLNGYIHCFNGDVTLEMLQQSKFVGVEDMRKAFPPGERDVPKELKIRLDGDMRIEVPVDGDLKISLSEKSFMLVTKTGVIMGRKAKIAKPLPLNKSWEICEHREMKMHERKRRKEIVKIHGLAKDAPGITVVSAEPSEDNSGNRCVRLILSNGRRALMY